VGTLLALEIFFSICFYNYLQLTVGDVPELDARALGDHELLLHGGLDLVGRSRSVERYKKVAFSKKQT
jgi:hypothetical protein